MPDLNLTDTAPAPIAPALLTVAETARYLGVASSTLNNQRSLGVGGPPYVRVGRSIRYRRTDLEAYIASLETVEPVAA